MAEEGEVVVAVLMERVVVAGQQRWGFAPQPKHVPVKREERSGVGILLGDVEQWLSEDGRYLDEPPEGAVAA